MADEEKGTKPAKPAKAERISVRAFTEERPELNRDVVGILNRVHREERKTREEWTTILSSFGGKQ